jgi:hypothetical protein
MVCPVDRDTLAMADRLPGHDLEDNLQIACAIVGKLDAILTRDPAGFQQSPIRVLTPNDFLRQFSADIDRHGAT